MSEIMTVLGPLPPAKLGWCQFHEHIAITQGISSDINPALCINDPEKSTAEVLGYKKAGGMTLVDAQPGGCCRSVSMLRTISRLSGVSVIASTGFHKLDYYPQNHWIRTISEKDLTAFYTEELTGGMYTETDRAFQPARSESRAGIVKTALTAEGLTPVYRRLFLAAARAAVKTDRTMMIHIDPGSDPLMLQDFLRDAGVSPSRMVFCHLDRAIPDFEIHKEIAFNGSFLEYDTIGRFKYHSDAQEIERIAALVDAGFEDRLMLSLDTTAARLKAYTPGAVGLDYILTVFADELSHAGINRALLRKTQHDNCLRAFNACTE